ncbi:uncharacterized protein LOC143283298 [Babylonia areolata]|uniref:uncharacterized protein LOC143283298 n=1 Tax=Babylonia areolata TaxID=304850 RepID=UPI003FCFF741
MAPKKAGADRPQVFEGGYIDDYVIAATVTAAVLVGVIIIVIVCICCRRRQMTRCCRCLCLRRKRSRGGRLIMGYLPANIAVNSAALEQGVPDIFLRGSQAGRLSLGPCSTSFDGSSYAAQGPDSSTPPPETSGTWSDFMRQVILIQRGSAAWVVEGRALGEAGRVTKDLQKGRIPEEEGGLSEEEDPQKGRIPEEEGGVTEEEVGGVTVDHQKWRISGNERRVPEEEEDGGSVLEKEEEARVPEEWRVVRDGRAPEQERVPVGARLPVEGRVPENGVLLFEHRGSQRTGHSTESITIHTLADDVLAVDDDEALKSDVTNDAVPQADDFVNSGALKGDVTGNDAMCHVDDVENDVTGLKDVTIGAVHYVVRL